MKCEEIRTTRVEQRWVMRNFSGTELWPVFLGSVTKL